MGPDGFPRHHVGAAPVPHLVDPLGRVRGRLRAAVLASRVGDPGGRVFAELQARPGEGTEGGRGE